MSDNEAREMTAPPDQTISVTFEFGQAYDLVRGDQIKHFPSYVKPGEPIVIGPLPMGLNPAEMQAAINGRAAELAIVAQALGLASSLLHDAIAALGTST